MIRVTFEDEQQDFLEWDIKDGVVAACRPFQGWLWNGTKVHNASIKPGDLLDITAPKQERATLNYRVIKVEKIEE